MRDKKHLTQEGWDKVLALKASSNKGLSNELKVAFPGVIPANKPEVLKQEEVNPQWVAGFVSGDGCFFVNIFSSPQSTCGFKVKLHFKISQHVRDEKLMRSLISYFGCGNYY